MKVWPYNSYLSKTNILELLFSIHIYTPYLALVFEYRVDFWILLLSLDVPLTLIAVSIIRGRFKLKENTRTKNKSSFEINSWVSLLKDGN